MSDSHSLRCNFCPTTSAIRPRRRSERARLMTVRRFSGEEHAGSTQPDQLGRACSELAVQPRVEERAIRWADATAAAWSPATHCARAMMHAAAACYGRRMVPSVHEPGPRSCRRLEGAVPCTRARLILIGQAQGLDLIRVFTRSLCPQDIDGAPVARALLAGSAHRSGVPTGNSGAADQNSTAVLQRPHRASPARTTHAHPGDDARLVPKPVG